MELRGCLLREKTGLPREVVRGLEPFVNACKSEVRHIVEQSKVVQHGDAYLLGRDLWTVAEQSLFDVAGQGLDRRVADRPVLAGGEHARDQLFAMKRLAFARSLHDEQHSTQKPLEGRESEATVQALPAPPHGITVLDLSRIHDAVVKVGTTRTSHVARLSPRRMATIRSLWSNSSLRDEEVRAWLEGGAANFCLELVDNRTRIARRRET